MTHLKAIAIAIHHKIQAIDFSVLIAAYVPVHFTWIAVNHALASTSAILGICYTLWKWNKERKK